MDLKQNRILALYQEWLKYLTQSNNDKALIASNLKRLSYVVQANPNKEANILYINALQKYYEDNKKSSSADLIILQMVNFHYNNFDYKVKNGKSNYQIADSLCDIGLKTSKDSNSIQFFQSIKSIIRSPSLNIEQEKIIPSKEFSKFLVSYSNLNQLYFKLYKVPFTGLKDIILPSIPLKNDQLSKFKLVKSWSDSWTNPVDFKAHSVELKIDPLELGRYYIVASNKEKIDESSSQKGGFFLVSNLATFQFHDLGNQSNVVVVDRTKGNPISEAKVIFFSNQRIRYDQPPKIEINSTKTTNADGKVEISTKEYLQYYVTKGKDIYTDDIGVSESYENHESEYTSLHYFLDRSIYRPGQTVYFKILAVNSGGQLVYPKIAPNKTFEISLKNANYQEVSSISVKTNSFGSASGSFVLPKSGLNGGYTLESKQGSQYFQVDEYKRPNFEVTFDTLKKAYKLNDEIEVKGKVQSYNGIALESNIKYRINRQNYFPWFLRWYSWRPELNSNEQIDFGSTRSNEKGEFTIKFKAKESKDEHSKNTIQQFNIEVDATDLNQETHSNTQSISLSNKQIFINSDLKPYINPNQDSINIEVKNISGVNLEASIKLKIYSLKSPKKYLRKRLWAQPDILRFEKNEFVKLFPYDVFTNEDQMENWPDGKLVFEKSFNNVYNTRIPIADFKLNEGSYKFEIEASEKNGNKDTLKQFTTVISEKSKFNSINPEVTYSANRIEPNSSLLINFLAINEPYNIYYRLNSRFVKSKNWNKVSNLNSITYKVKDEDRGGLDFRGICILKNRVYNFSKRIEVPWSNKELKIESLSFRDKLLPGQNEEWTFKISDRSNSKDKVELLASMYDQSLDQILMHQWNFNILPSNYSNIDFYTNSISTFPWNELKYYESRYG
ncbi:MAG: MG2 domain-containing protein, partial [Saprospiraceae bacterium]